MSRRGTRLQNEVDLNLVIPRTKRQQAIIEKSKEKEKSSSASTKRTRNGNGTQRNGSPVR